MVLAFSLCYQSACFVRSTAMRFLVDGCRELAHTWALFNIMWFYGSLPVFQLRVVFFFVWRLGRCNFRVVCL